MWSGASVLSVCTKPAPAWSAQRFNGPEPNLLLSLTLSTSLYILRSLPGTTRQCVRNQFIVLILLPSSLGGLLLCVCTWMCNYSYVVDILRFHLDRVHDDLNGLFNVYIPCHDVFTYYTKPANASRRWFRVFVFGMITMHIKLNS